MQRYDKKAMGLILFSREAMPLFLSQKLIMFLQYSKIASFHFLLGFPWESMWYNLSGHGCRL